MAPLEKWLSAGRVEVPQGAVLGPFSDGSPRALPRHGSISSQLLISKAHYFVLRLAVRQSSGAPAAVPPWPFTKPIIYFGTAALLAWALIYAPVGVLAASCEKHRSINTSSAVQSERQETKDCHSGKQMQKKQMRHANAEGGKVPEAACLGGEQQEKRKNKMYAGAQVEGSDGGVGREGGGGGLGKKINSVSV
ncbi:hypothetical protein DPX16_13729 [Anabarilius grahami]|uniref:Uncharacterized protein n=1 Tax=Anabarilius grahami TaxID=495550 RepID=A0A3N0XRU4_ANAGA|nr:hypothetical protein DPX16_13729 [Anabarilius grahami]